MYPTSNVIHRIFNVRVVNNTEILAGGTAFVVDQDNREYVITARHIAEHLEGGDIQVMRGDGWVTYPAKSREHGKDTIDVSVIALLDTLVLKEGRFPLPLGLDGIIYGQEAMFLGFPVGYDPDSTPRLANGLPLPLVKYDSLVTRGFRVGTGE